MRKIWIVYASDENFLMQTYVSIYSVLKERKTQYYINFMLLVPAGTRRQEYDRGWAFDDYSICFEEIENTVFDDLPMTVSHITKPAYYRLLIPQILKDVKKCIYLDGDTICRSDIMELYEEEIDGFYLGGRSINWDSETTGRVERDLGIPDGKQCVNSGVLLMNLKELRKISRELVVEAGKYPMLDQDTINKCCYGNIKILHLKYNLMSNAEKMYQKGMLLFYDKKTIEEAIQHPCIIHYLSKYTKPWNNNRCAGYDLWWGIAREALPQEAVSELEQAMVKNMNAYSDEELFERIEEAEKIIIFGFGKAGVELEEKVIKKFGKEKLLCFCDNDDRKIGQSKDGIEVYPIETALKMPYEPLVVVTPSGCGGGTARAAAEYGLDENPDCPICLQGRKVFHEPELTSERLKISVIVPVYNTEQYLDKCIDSILSQTFKDYELILVDDGSTDNSGKICDEYAEKYHHIKVIHTQNGGQNAARLEGLRVAVGEYIQFIDSDDCIEADMLEAMYDMAALYNADVVSSSMSGSCHIPAGVYDTKEKMRYIRKHLIYNEKISKYAGGSLCNRLIRKELVEYYMERIPKSVRHMEDVAVTMCCIAHSRCVVIMEEAFYHYTKRRDSITHRRDDRCLSQLNEWYLFIRDEMKDLAEYKEIKRQIDLHLMNVMLTAVNKYMGLEKDIDIPAYLLPKLTVDGKALKIVLYGAGAVGQSYYQQIRNRAEYELAVWVDKNVRDDDVQPVSALKSVEFDMVLIAVLDEKMAEDIKRSLKEEFGIEEGKIFWRKPEMLLEKFISVEL